MNDYKVLTQDKFEALLLWLSPSREEAGEKYEKIRQSLLRFFYFKGCSNPEDLTDETINRVVGKIESLDLSTNAKPITIFLGFANNVFLENLKLKIKEIQLEEGINLKAEKENQNEKKFDDLEKCLRNLPHPDRVLLIEYYVKEKSQKFEYRRNLADKYNLTMGAMHIKLHRLRKSLRSCIEKLSKKNNL